MKMKLKFLGFVALLILMPVTLVSCASATDHAKFVSETLPDRSVVDAGTSFTKTWTFQNDGTVDWVGYKLNLFSTNIKTGKESNYLIYPKSVIIPTTPKGKSVTISLPLKAPNPAWAAQESTWKIQTNSKLVVSGGTVTLKVTINPTQGSNIPNLRSSAYLSPTNKYAASGFGGQCTAFAWGRAYEKQGIKLTFIKNNYPSAYLWYKETTSPKGQIPMADSVAVWASQTGGTTGQHVAYIESITGNHADNTDPIVINEANFNSVQPPQTYPWGGGYDGKLLNTLTRKSINGHLSSGIAGYIYLNNKPLSISPSSGSRGTTFTFSGKGFTPNGKLEWHVKDPKGAEYPVDTRWADASGNMITSYKSTSSSPTGIYTIWAVDKSRGTSNEVKESLT